MWLTKFSSVRVGPIVGARISPATTSKLPIRVDRSELGPLLAAQRDLQRQQELVGVQRDTLDSERKG
jgi:hypothetical protein